MNRYSLRKGLPSGESSSRARLASLTGAGSACPTRAGRGVGCGVGCVGVDTCGLVEYCSPAVGSGLALGGGG